MPQTLIRGALYGFEAVLIVSCQLPPYNIFNPPAPSFEAAFSLWALTKIGKSNVGSVHVS